MSTEPSDERFKVVSPKQSEEDRTKLVSSTALQDGTLILRLAGSIDITTQGTFRRALDHIAAGDTIAVDLRAVRFIDSSGMGVLFHLLQCLGAAMVGCTFVIAPYGQVERALALTQMDRRLQLVRLPIRAHPTSLDLYKDYLYRRWIAGCQNAGQLYREIQAQGFTGAYFWLGRYIAGLRRGQEQQEAGQQQSQGKGQTRMTLAAATSTRAPSSRSVTAMLLHSPEDLSLAEKAFLEQLCQASEPIRVTRALTNRFLAMVRQRRKDDLSAWLTEAKQTGLTACPRWSVSLKARSTILPQSLPDFRCLGAVVWLKGK